MFSVSLGAVVPKRVAYGTLGCLSEGGAASYNIMYLWTFGPFLHLCLPGSKVRVPGEKMLKNTALNARITVQ